MKKSKGSGSILEDVFGGIIVILSICILVVAVLNVFHAYTVNENVKELARAYILEMETVGYLSSGSQSALMQELAALEVTDVDISGTTLTDAGYGNRIYLCIKCSIPAKALNTTGDSIFSYFFEEMKWDVDIKRMSTSKR